MRCLGKRINRMKRIITSLLYFDRHLCKISKKGLLIAFGFEPYSAKCSFVTAKIFFLILSNNRFILWEQNFKNCKIKREIKLLRLV